MKNQLIIFLLILSVLSISCNKKNVEKQIQKSPNFIVVFIDDMGLSLSIFCSLFLIFKNKKIAV